MGPCTEPWLTHPVLLRVHSLDNGALFHGKPHPVLALGSITLPVGVCIAVCQAGHIELLLGRDREVESAFTPQLPARGWGAEEGRRGGGGGRGRCFGSGRTREKTQCNWVKSALVWVELSRGFYRISNMGGQIESGLWGFRFSLALGVRVLDLAKCDYILLRMGGFPAPTV